MRVEMKNRLLLLVALGVIAGACTMNHSGSKASALNARALHGGISNVWLLAEDPSANLEFCPHPESVTLVSCLSLSSIVTSVPTTWPRRRPRPARTRTGSS
jgi:hypothetical protein